MFFFFFFQAEDGIRVVAVTGVQTCALPISLKALSHLPVIVDPSHATGKWELVAPMAKAAIAAGADGLLIEVHSNPECALCDGEESLKPSKFKELMKDLKKIAEAVDREI